MYVIELIIVNAICVMMNKIKNFLSPILLLYGMIFYLIFKKNTIVGHQSMIRSYILTKGLSNNFFTKIISIFQKKKFFENDKIFFSNNLDASLDKKNIIKELNLDGYAIPEIKLSNKDINHLINFAKNNRGGYKNANNDLVEMEFKDFDFSNTTFNYDENILLENSLIKKLSINRDFLDIAQNYFSSTPIISAINMWWSIPSKNIDSEAGQMFHFDMDRIKFLKFFIYLTDVDKLNGPHCYVAGTHRPNKKKKLLNRGYVRISDNEIKNNYPKSKIKEIISNAGTIIIGDTSCFHKGLPPLSTKRLILEIEYSNSLFGSDTAQIFNPTKKLLKKDKIYQPLIELNSDIVKRYC